MNIHPLNDRILVQRIPDPSAESSFLITPDVAKPLSTWGRVVSVGPGKRTRKGERIPVAVKPGDVILFGKYVDFDEDNYVMIQEADIRGVVQNA